MLLAHNTNGKVHRKKRFGVKLPKANQSTFYLYVLLNSIRILLDSISKLSKLPRTHTVITHIIKKLSYLLQKWKYFGNVKSILTNTIIITNIKKSLT